MIQDVLILQYDTDITPLKGDTYSGTHFQYVIINRPGGGNSLPRHYLHVLYLQISRQMARCTIICTVVCMSICSSCVFMYVCIDTHQRLLGNLNLRGSVHPVLSVRFPYIFLPSPISKP